MKLLDIVRELKTIFQVTKYIKGLRNRAYKIREPYNNYYNPNQVFWKKTCSGKMMSEKEHMFGKQLFPARQLKRYKANVV